MDIKINIVNDKFTKISPLAFGSTFSNLSEFVVDETPEKTFENIGVNIGMKITDYVGVDYKIKSIKETDNNDYIVNIEQISGYF